MGGRLNLRHTWLVALVLALAWGVPHVALAQGTNGKVEGVVKDTRGEPVDGATVTLQPAQGRRIEGRTNRAGQYSLTVAAGDYTIFATKGNALKSVPSGARVGAGATMSGADLVLMDSKEADAAMAKASADAKAAEATNTAFKGAFDAAVAAANAGQHDAAIAKFTEAAAANPKCSDCYSNMGSSYLQKKDYDNAEKAFNKANEIKPNEQSYTGLASVYTAQRKMDQAATAMQKAMSLGPSTGAAGGGDANTLYNQGVTLWNAGKIDDAKKQFQAAVAADPKHAEAHYQLGMALVNEGNLPGAAAEWNTYLQLSPSGPHAAEVKAMLPSLK